MGGCSSKMVAANKPLGTFEEYPGVLGKAISCTMDMRELSNYYKPDPRVKLYDHGWDSDGPSKYVPSRIAGYDDAIKAIQDFQFPLDIKRQAARASRHLVGAFERIVSPTILKDLEYGRVDRHKIPAITKAIATNTYRTSSILPAKKVLPSPSKRPVLAIVADANFMHMWMDAEFIPKMLVLSTGILWACEAVGLSAYATLVAGHNSLSRKVPYQEAIWSILFASPHKVIALKRYAAMLHRDMYRWALILGEAADYDCWKKFQYLEDSNSSAGSTWAARDGGYSVNYARQILKADVVISIGNNLDQAKADIKLGYDFQIEDAVKQIALQAKKLKGDSWS